MARTITIDPVTRIEGHLRINVEVDKQQVAKAWCSGQMWRGIELILKGRDPREAWVFTQRICGVCTTVHAIASVRSVENALGIMVPKNAQYIRNLMLIAHAMHDHIVHFYHLSALDWVDVISALSADPKNTLKLAEQISNWPGNSLNAFVETKAKLKRQVDSGQLGIFAHGYWGHKAMRLPPEANLLAVTHYLQALDVQRKANQAVAILGGKTPNIQNLAVGGVANAINLNNQATLNMKKLFHIKSLIDEVETFIDQVYLPDVVAIASLYPDWFGYGAGVTNYLAVPDLPLDETGTQFELPGGFIEGAALDTLQVIDKFGDPLFKEKIKENVAHAWYQGDQSKHPYEESSEVLKPEFDPAGKYSFVKAPRFDGKPAQVGPLAQLLVGLAQGDEPSKRWLGKALDMAKAIGGQELGIEALHSTLGRHLARALRCRILAELGGKHWRLLIDNIGKGDCEICTPFEFPKGEQRGFGFHEAPRGALSHWIVIRNGKIQNYQAVVPSTWNTSPRDEYDMLGPCEASLVGNPVADPERPLELLRTIHSFDPCLACAIHTVTPQGKVIAVVRAL